MILFRYFGGRRLTLHFLGKVKSIQSMLQIDVAFMSNFNTAGAHTRTRARANTQTHTHILARAHTTHYAQPHTSMHSAFSPETLFW